ncbi:LysR family transcriptional regulator [Seongchinamella unica]|uniref:LysR family transcriptional regulator n=1 Tax=Seongchinamella unica TaxID=2547392 RepID=A0A4R5LV19_9GAMM|nr:LysR family transcriptional regulator [Seongchinamella unica]TDG15263.1 LysR family transcriptional regulator [Seongchinamella unica]
MNITLRQLRAFATLARSQSFAEASELLHLSQSALSVAIKKMEQEVGGSLFSRSTRSLELSPEGRNFLPTARRLLADWDEAFDDLGRSFSLQQGKISVAVMPSFAMNQFPEALASFQQEYPELNIGVEDVVMEDTIEAVRSGHVDLGITFEPEQLDGVDFTPLFEDHWIALVHPDSPLAGEPQLSWQQLVQQPFIAMNRGSWSRATTEAAMATAGVSPGQLLEAQQLATIGRMVSVGLGVAVVPQLCRQQMEAMAIVCKPLDGPAIARRVGIFTRKRHGLSRPAHALFQHLQDHFGSGL